MSTTAVNTAYSGNASSILGQAEAQFQQPKTAGNSSLGKNDFLNLLMTQLQHQDPLNPQDDKEFVAQLSQFSSLEQLTNISSGVDTLNKSITQQQMFSAASFIGKEVKAKGDSLSVSDGAAGPIYYTLPKAASSVSLNFMDSNGNIVRTLNQGAQAAGDQTYQWDAKNSNGKSVTDGTYRIGVTAYGADGSPMMVNTNVTGLVTGVSNSNGKFLLTTQDGRGVYFEDVQGLNTPVTTTK